MKRQPRVCGFTLSELIVALVLAAVVLGAAYQVLLSSQRFYLAQAAVLEVHQGMRAVVQVLSAELRELDAAGGDVVAVAPDSVSIRAARRLEFVCAPPDAAGRIWVRNSLSFGFRDADPARDRALVFRDGDPGSADDDAWIDFGISSVSTGGRCSDGAAATEIRLIGPISSLDSVSVGSPVRSYERAVYRLYADDAGAWWLGVRTRDNDGWAAVSPVAGPLGGKSGLILSYFDAAGAATSDPSRVARIDFAVRGLSSAVLQGVGGVQTQYADSLRATVSLRNGPMREAP